MVQKLTKKQELFIKEYLIDLNATQAAVRAGYSKKTAKLIGFENLTKPYIAEVIDKKIKERSEKVEITAEYVLKNLKSVTERCMQSEPILFKDGDNWIESGEYKFDSSGANKALELLGKHLKMFTDKIEHLGKDGKDLQPIINVSTTKGTI